MTLNRPDKLNAVDEQMHGELASLFSDVANDPHSEIIVLTGAGRAFSAGGDIDWMQKMIDIPHSFEKTAREGRRIIYSLLDWPRSKSKCNNFQKEIVYAKNLPTSTA